MANKKIIPLRNNNVIEDSPSQIDLALTGTFGKCEVEIAARDLIKFFIFKGGWKGFTIIEYIDWLKENGQEKQKPLFGLITHWWNDSMLTFGWLPPREVFIVQDEEGIFYVTKAFVDQCMKRT